MTQEVLQERIDAYCKRYKVPKRGATGLPPYPAGERETPQHRDWIVLYKAITRFRRRQAALPSSSEVAAAIAAQNGTCPLCLAKVDTYGQIAHQPAAGATTTVLHEDCNELLRLVLKAGPGVLDRVRSYVWPESGSSKGGKQR